MRTMTMRVGVSKREKKRLSRARVGNLVCIFVCICFQAVTDPDPVTDAGEISLTIFERIMVFSWV